MATLPVSVGIAFIHRSSFLIALTFGTFPLNKTGSGCDAGKFGKQATGCKDCIIGFYSPGGDVAACKECPKGYHGRDTIAQAQCTGAFVFLNVFCLYESV